MKNSLFLFLFIVSVSFASNFFISSSGGTYLSAYNAQVVEVPPPLRFLWSGEKANVHVSGLGTYGARFGDKGDVLEIGKGEYPDAALEISLSRDTLGRINSGELTLDEAVRGKQLVFRSNNIVAAAKLQVAMSFVNLGGVWDDIFGPGIDRMFSFLPKL